MTTDSMPDRVAQSSEAVDDIPFAILELPEAWREAVSLVCNSRLLGCRRSPNM